MLPVGVGPQGNRHNRRREAGSEAGRNAGGHRQFSEEVQTGPLLRETLRHRGRGESLRRGGHTGENFFWSSFFLSFCFYSLVHTGIVFLFLGEC